MTSNSKSLASVELLAKLKTGQVVKDRYLVEDFIGNGTSARVYRCRDMMLGNLQVAFKVYSAAVIDDKTTEARVNREILSSFGVDHSNIARFYDCIRTDEFIGMVMEYVEGKTLQQLLEDGEVMSLMEVLHMLQQVAAGLQAIHDAGVLHRDFKPANIMISGNGDVKITDFGLAKFIQLHSENQKESEDTLVPGTNNVKRSTVTEINDVVGTPVYLAPEYLESGVCDERSDIYAMGIIAYELITGTVPFDYDNFYQLVESKLHSVPPLPHELNPACPPELGAIIMKAMAINPEERFQAPREVAEAIEYFKRRRNQTLTELSNAVTISKMFSRVRPEEMDELKKHLESGAIDATLLRQRQRERKIEESMPRSPLMDVGEILADNMGMLLLLFFFIAIGLALVLAANHGVDWNRVTEDLTRIFSTIGEKK